MKTGILPEEGSLQDQSAAFVEVFDVFVARWHDRLYAKLWGDVRQFAESILNGLFGKGKTRGSPREPDPG